MSTNEIVNFERTDGDVAKLIGNAIKQKDYWKALGLLNSLSGKNNSIWVKRLAYDLHLLLPHYSNLKDDFLPLIVSNDIDAVLLASRGIVDYFLPIDEDVAEFYSDFVEKRLSNMGIAFDQVALHENFGIPSFSKAFEFVEIDDAERDILHAADEALNDGEMIKVCDILRNATMTGENDAISKKIQAEALYAQKLYRDADEKLKEVEDEYKDIYYYALLSRVLYETDKQKVQSALDKMLEFEIEAEEHLIFVAETFLDLQMTQKAFDVLQKNEHKYQYFAPFQFAKGLAALELQNEVQAKDAFLKAYLLSSRNVVAYEMYLCLEEGVKLPKLIKINDVLPKALVKRVYDRIASLFSLDYEELKNLSYGKLANIIYWVEELRDREVAERVAMLFLTFEKGVEIIKNELLSLSASEWIKRVLVKMIVLAGAADITIWFSDKNILKSVSVRIPQTIETELQFLSENNSSFKNVFEMFFTSYAEAFSRLAFEIVGFEARLQEVGQVFLRSLLEFDKKDQKLLSKNVLLGAILYSTCSDDLPIDFSAPKAECSKFCTLENAAGECDTLASCLKEVIKMCF